MKKSLLSFFFSLFAWCVLAQTPINLTFIGRDSISQDLIALDSVYVKNITENCNSTLYGEAPVLSIMAQWPVAVEPPALPKQPSFVLHQNFPNPFNGLTTVHIYRECGGQLTLMLMNGLGAPLTEYSGELEQGLHTFSISTGGHSVLFLVARDSRTSHSIKLICSGTALAPNAIRHLGYTPEGDETANLKGTSSDGFLYFLGNQLSYTAYTTGFREKIILDSPVADNTYYFDMAQLLPPTVTTDAVTDITQSTATCGGNVSGDGGAEVTARGVCWSISPNPTTAGSHTLNGGGLGAFVSYVTNMSANTLYYVRAYATNSIGTVYGNEVAFTTGQPITAPVVTTAPVTNITQTTATSGGTVTSDGGAEVTARGVCWGTSPNLNLADSHTIDGTGTGTFVSSITGLTGGGTVYYVRAYASNMIGNSYGDELTFTTLALPTVITAAITDTTQSTATSGGTVTSDGGAAVTARGVCWSTSTNPTTADSYTTDSTGIGTFTSSLTALTPATLYLLRAYATNSVGTSYGSELAFTTLNISAGPPTCPGVSTVTYSGQTYNTVLVGTQCWLRESLNVGTRISGYQNQTNNGILEKYCHSNLDVNCDIYGGLYQWNELMQYVSTAGAQGICPTGWHLPTDAEFTTLTIFLGGIPVAGGKMKETGLLHWFAPNTGATNSSGFTALPGGYRSSDGSFDDLSNFAIFWSSTELDATIARYRRLLYSLESVYSYTDYKTKGFSCRCIKN